MLGKTLQQIALFGILIAISAIMVAGFFKLPSAAALGVLEIAFAIAMFKLLPHRFVIIVLMMTYLVFVFVNSIAVINNESSCGCFGDVKIPPVFTLLFDIAVLFPIAAGLFQYKYRPLPDFKPVCLALALAWVCLALGHEINRQYAADKNELVHLLVGQKLPPGISSSCCVDLSRGKYELLVLNQSCPTCDIYIEQCKNQLTMIMVDDWIKFYAKNYEPKIIGVKQDSPFFRNAGRLTPCTVYLTEGTVTSVSLF